MKENFRHNDQALLEEVRGLKDILNVAQVVVSSLDVDEVLQNILHSAMAIMDMPAGSIALYDEDSARLQIHAHFGLSKRFLAHDRWQVQAGGLTHEILECGNLFVVEDTRKTDCFTNPLAIEEGIRSLIAMPLKMQDKIVGVLYVDDFKPRSFPEMRLKQLAILAAFATMSIDNARLHAMTARMACTDGLTGLYNHRQFKQQVAEELARAVRYHKPLSIIMLDVDDFKNYNDSYGHPVGDLVLREIARQLRDLLRGCDTIFRYGGEEFIVLLPETGIDAALMAAERIRSSIETESPGFLTAPMPTRGVTVSAGVAAWPDDGRNVEALLKTVDDLMYRAKREGKNKVYYRSGTN